MARRWRLLIAIGLLAARPALATEKYGPVQISGNLQSQNLIRHPDAATYQFIQNRNTIHLRLDYDWLEAGRFYNRYSVPFIESSHLFLLWRGVYDSVYDTTPGFIQKTDIHGHAYGSGTQTVFELARTKGIPRSAFTLDGLNSESRDALKFDNQIREAYFDLKFRGLPLTVRAGRQQIVWGESDDFRMLDRINTLDLTWHLAQEVPPPAFGWDEIRRPFWMLKFLYSVGDVWRFSQNFLEWYWNPGDWQPAKVAFLPRPWGLPILDPLTNPVDGGFIEGLCATSPFHDRQGRAVCTRLKGGTELFKRGNYDRNPMDNSQVGVRYHAIAPAGIEFTLNYFYQRWGGDDGTDYAPLKAVARTFNRKRDVALVDQYFGKGIFAAEYYTPYIHTVGASANYADETYTQAVYRFESIYDFGIPFFDMGSVTIVDKPALPGIARKNMWKGMIGFDRPTWIRWLNRKSTIFISGQFFWHHLVSNPSCDPAARALLSPAARARSGECLVGGLDLPTRERATPPFAYRDKIRDWEALATLAAFTFYRGGSVLPVVGIAVDPVNHYSMEPFWSVDYLVRGNVALNLTQRYFVTPTGDFPIHETWGLGGLSHGRSETSVRLTYQF